MSHDDLIARLDESLPKADERESVWCSVQGHDLRAAVQAIAAQAAEISALHAEIDACHKRILALLAERDGPITDATYLGLSEDIARLTVERDAAVADAERYQWLRDNCVDEVGDTGDLGLTFHCDFEHYNDVDAAIDAARQPTAQGAGLT